MARIASLYCQNNPQHINLLKALIISCLTVVPVFCSENREGLNFEVGYWA